MEIESSNHLLPDDIKWAIVFYKSPHIHIMLPILSNREIARIVGGIYNRPTLSHKQVKYVYDKYLETNSVDNIWNSEGRPRSLTAQQVDELIQFAINNRSESCNTYKEELKLDVSRKTVNNALLEKGYKCYRAPPKLIISNNNIIARRNFAREHLNWNMEDWQRIVFSDESSFSLVNTNGRMMIRRKSNEALIDEAVQPYDNFAKSVLVWGAISYDHMGPLVRVEGTLDSASYIRLFNYRLRKWFPGLYNGEQVFQQDNAKPHIGSYAMNWFDKYDIEVMDWPSQSPDLNIIEDVWNMIKYQLKGQVFGDQDELWEEILAIWNSIDQRSIQKLYESLPRRMEALREAQGSHTKY